MKMECEVIRDLLPLYADDVCSPASRALVDEHLNTCADCSGMLERLKASEIEDKLSGEKAQVIRYQTKRFKRRSAAVGSTIATVFMIPILICLIVNITSGASLGWFFIVVASLAVAGSLTVVPLTVPEDKLFWTFCAFCASLMVLLGVCCLYTRGDWFWVAATASLFGLSVALGPFVLRARPVKRLVGNRSKLQIALTADIVLFAVMMNAIRLRAGRGIHPTTTILVLLVAAGLLALDVMRERRNGK